MFKFGGKEEMKGGKEEPGREGWREEGRKERFAVPLLSLELKTKPWGLEAVHVRQEHHPGSPPHCNQQDACS